ncbi:hypothetical protein CAOG_009730 [Capsaspora owczarzaki ATCC 30864]|uniref:Signal recognition particle subunit SRP68 n=1 Tax=Capsaspora owczarzaki (strain ATCC 30864) TaxID=595528 RepID=A0A0D2X2T2_CAPO3|nr:hypothetical protein CAOG_009730 [Capsaspora owczarzaki ATCC 30864]
MAEDSSSSAATEPLAPSTATTESPSNTATATATATARPVFSLFVLPVIHEVQQQHGLRHADFRRYHGFCNARLYRLRRSLKFMYGRNNRYQKKELKLEHITDERFLFIPLIKAERSWAYAMLLKSQMESDARKRFHMQRRLKKAYKHALALANFCSSDKLVDPRTTLEAQAYKEWIHGVLWFERRAWSKAIKALTSASAIYSKLGLVCPAEQRALYSSKVDELLPSIRFCAFNLKGSNPDANINDIIASRMKQTEAAARQSLTAKFDAVLSLNRDTNSQSQNEIVWRGRTAPVKNEKLRTILTRVQQTNFELDQLRAAHTISTDSATTSTTGSADPRLEMFDQLFAEYNDAISLLKDELRGDSVHDKKGAQKSEALADTLRFLLAYISYQKLSRTIERNLILIAAAKERLPAETEAAASATVAVHDAASKPTRPDDIVRLYDIILQNLADMNELGGLDNDPEFTKELAARTLYFKTFRCFYVAESYLHMSQWREAIALYDRSSSHRANAVAHFEQCANSGQFHVRLALLKNKKNKKTNHKLQRLTRMPLTDRLDIYLQDPSLHSKKPNIITFPPDFGVVAGKPLFFDLALNAVTLPSLSHRAASKKPAAKAAPQPKQPQAAQQQQQQQQQQQAPAQPTTEQTAAPAEGVFGTVKGLFGWGKR